MKAKILFLFLLLLIPFAIANEKITIPNGYCENVTILIQNETNESLNYPYNLTICGEETKYNISVQCPNISIPAYPILDFSTMPESKCENNCPNVSLECKEPVVQVPEKITTKLSGSTIIMLFLICLLVCGTIIGSKIISFKKKEAELPPINKEIEAERTKKGYMSGIIGNKNTNSWDMDGKLLMLKDLGKKKESIIKFWEENKHDMESQNLAIDQMKEIDEQIRMLKDEREDPDSNK